MGKVSEVFSLSIELANLLNYQKSNNVEYLKPSEVKFTWSKELFKKFQDYLEELKTKIKYNENGTSHESYGTLMIIRGECVLKSEKMSDLKIADEMYQTIYHYSDRWSLSSMTQIVAYVDVLKLRFSQLP